MYAISPALAAALAGPGPDRVRAWGELWSAGVKTATVELSEGQITLDSTAGVRASVRVTLPSIDGLIPEVGTSGHDRTFGEGTFGSGIYGEYKRRYLVGLLVPLKTELRLFWQGRLPGTSTWETVPLGRYQLSNPSYNDTPEGQSVTLTGLDVSSTVAAAKWTSPYRIAKGTNVATALTALLTNRVPGLTVITPSTTETTPRILYAPGYNQGGDPWQDATKLAASAGWMLYVNRVGQVVAEPPADPSAGGTAVWSLRDDGTAQRFVRTPDAADIVNTVIVFAESSGEKPVVAVVTDEHGPYGTDTLGYTIAREYRASNIRTLTQAQNAGIAQLHKLSTVTETVDIACFPAPHLDPADLVSVWSDALELEDDLFASTRVVFDLNPKTPTTVKVSRRI